MSTKRPRSPSPNTTDDDIYTSEPIIDRQSTFIAHYSPSLHAKSLQKLPDLATASHRMVAWRFPSTQRTITNSSQAPRKQLFETGYDDDGEKGGGRTLEKLMESMQVTGSVMVARWYGGVMLGPVRFTHIETCAVNAVKSWKEEQAAKKRQVEQDKADEEDRMRLPEALEERDKSISVLRKLLEQKKARNLKGTQDGSVVAATPPTPSKKMEYAAMPVESLRKLESARDRTIAFLLKQIDAQEELEKASETHEHAVESKGETVRSDKPKQAMEHKSETSRSEDPEQTVESKNDPISSAEPQKQSADKTEVLETTIEVQYSAEVDNSSETKNG